MPNKISNLCTKMPRLPTTANTRNYRSNGFQAEFDAAMQLFPNPAEWEAVATAANAVIYKHHHCGGKHCCATVPCVLTMGLCFCPLCYVGCVMKKNVDAELATLPEVQQLQARGITLEWIPNGDLGSAGGMTIISSSQAAPPTQTQKAMGR